MAKEQVVMIDPTYAQSSSLPPLAPRTAQTGEDSQVSLPHIDVTGAWFVGIVNAIKLLPANTATATPPNKCCSEYFSRSTFTSLRQ